MHSSRIYQRAGLTLVPGGASPSAEEQLMAIPYDIVLRAQGFAQASNALFFDVLNEGFAWADQQELTRRNLVHWPSQAQDLLIRRNVVDDYKNLASFIVAQERICSPRSILGTWLGLYLDYRVEQHKLPLQRGGVVSLSAYRRAKHGSQ